jgi:hypothetical protein
MENPFLNELSSMASKYRDSKIEKIQKDLAMENNWVELGHRNRNDALSLSTDKEQEAWGFSKTSINPGISASTFINMPKDNAFQQQLVFNKQSQDLYHVGSLSYANDLYADKNKHSGELDMNTFNNNLYDREANTPWAPPRPWI